MKIIAGLLAALFLVSVSIEMSKSQAATAIAYASLHQEKKVDPKPDPGEGLIKAKCADECKCVKCECTECECLNPVKEVKWVQTSPTTGEHQYLENGKVTGTRKWALKTTYAKSCNGRSCTLIPVRKWVLLK
jgi:hypothetical protein